MAQTYGFMSPAQQSRSQNDGGWEPVPDPSTATLSDGSGDGRSEAEKNGGWWDNYSRTVGNYDPQTNPGPSSTFTSPSPNPGNTEWVQATTPYTPPDTGQPNYAAFNAQNWNTPPMGASPGTSAALPEGYGNSLGFWNGPDRAAAMNAFASTTIPLQQLQQNAWQYQNDFGEAQRRDDRNFAHQTYTDQQGINLAWDQQNMARWQAEQSANQWQKQFGFESGMANQQFGLENYATREGLRQSQQKMDNQFALEQRALDIEGSYRTGMLSLEQRNMALQELSNTQDYGLAQQGMALEQQLGLGGLDIDRQQLALQQQLGLGGLGLDQASLSQQWQRALLDAQLQREGYQNQQQIAAMQNFGRSQAPTSQWIRNY